jgi:hypothetical protein
MDQFIGEIRDDSFGAAIEARRHALHERGDLRDFHIFPFYVVVGKLRRLPHWDHLSVLALDHDHIGARIERAPPAGSVDGLVSGIKSHMIEAPSKPTDAILRNVAAQSKFAAIRPKSAVLSAAPIPDAVPMMP